MPKGEKLSRHFRRVTGGSETLQRIYDEYPALKQYGYRLLESDAPGKIEFYPPDESHNPMPGWPVIELQKDVPKGEWQEKAILGDMLHHLPRVDPKWAAMREEFRQTMTPEQHEASRRRYNWYVENRGEQRPYEQWFEISDLDAPIRAWIAPDEANEWNPHLPKHHRKLVERMRAHIKKAE